MQTFDRYRIKETNEQEQLDTSYSSSLASARL